MIPSFLLIGHFQILIIQMGNKCCASHTKQTDFKTKPKKNIKPIHRDKNKEEAKCILCHRSMHLEQYYQHLDLIHYAIEAESSENQKVFKCLLCGYKAINLQGHSIHLQMKHKYLKKKENNSLSIVHEIHQEIKDRVTEIAAHQVKKNKGDRVRIYGDQFKMIVFQKQYGPVEFSEQKSKGDLIWRYIFQDYPEAKYFLLEHEAGHKTIVSKGKIFIQIE